MKNILITGASGFIGSHLCEAFLKKGARVFGVDNLITGDRRNLEVIPSDAPFEFIEHDICDPLPEAWISRFEREGLAGVLHFACPASPVDFDKIPFEILHVDSLGTIQTVQLALHLKARYLLASTSEVYGDPLVHPQTESYWGNVNSIGPRACYDETKRFAEAYVSTAMRSPHDLNAAIVRIFNTYGPRMRPDDGRVVPELCMQALQSRPLVIHGDGSQTRSFCFVSDLVDGIVRLYESELREVVNLGNPDEKTILQFAKKILELTQSDSSLQFAEGRPDDPRKRCPDISKARKLLGWEPRIDLGEGLARSIEFFKSR